MTRTEAQLVAQLALVRAQRRFEWKLARTELAHAANALVSGKTHDLLNLVQIVELASLQLARRCDPSGQEFIADLERAADQAKHALRELMATARPEPVIVRGPPVGATITKVLPAIRAAIEVDAHLAVGPETATRLTGEELEHLIIALALDAIDAPRLDLHVRERTIEGQPWVEILRGAALPVEGRQFELRAVEALAVQAGGEVAHAERRGGGSELVVALPAFTSASA